MCEMGKDCYSPEECDECDIARALVISKARGSLEDTNMPWRQIIMEAHNEHYGDEHNEEYMLGDHSHGDHEICTNIEPVTIINCHDVGSQEEKCKIVGKECWLEHSMENGRLFPGHTKCVYISGYNM